MQQLYKRILLENEDAAARKYLLDKISKLPWAGPAMSWLPSVLLCPSSLTLAVSRAYALRWITGEEADARFVYRIHFSRPEVCAHCNQNMPKDQLYRFGCAFQGSYCPGCLAQLRVPLERLWSVHWCPELDGHLLRPTEAWVDIPMVAAAPPVRQDGPLPASALAYLEHPCLLCGTAENSVCHWLQSCPVLCLAARLLGAPGVLQLTDGNSKTAAMSIEVIAAARRYLRELGAMWAPGWHPPLAGSTGPLAHAIHIASRAYWHGPARLRAVYGAAPALLTTAAASGCLHARGLLVDPASAFTGRHWQTQRAPALRASCALPAGHDIAVLDPHAVEVAILYAPHVVAPPNVAVSHQPCGCGRTHAFVKALTAIPQGALLSAYTTQYPFDTIYVQFDGGCHTGPQVGGAGVAIWQGALLGPAHVSVSQPLCVCVDSYEAEAEARSLRSAGPSSSCRPFAVKDLPFKGSTSRATTWQSLLTWQGTVVFADQALLRASSPLGTH